MLALIVVGSFVGYLISIERYIELGGFGVFYSQLRMALIWPTRMLTAAFGQIAWDNTNYAAYYFALAFALILESLAVGGNHRPWIRWAWCVALVAGVYLTASRSGGMMGFLALALVLPGRPLRFLLMSLVVVGLGIAIGHGVLRFKESGISRQPVVPGKRIETADDHTSDYVKRASAGRTKAYRYLWDNMAGSRVCGRGLAVTGKDVLFLNHEHSSYVATFRGGGLVALAGLAPMRLAMECGRMIAGPYGYLVSRVLHKKAIYKNYVGLDACMANLMRPGLYGSYHHITVPAREGGPRKTYDVTGSLCENNDKFAVDREIADPALGDLLVLHDTGAHGHAMGFNYNGKLRSAEVLWQGGTQYRLIRRAETLADHFATLDFPGLKA